MSGVTVTGNANVNTIQSDNYQYANGTPIVFGNVSGGGNLAQINTGIGLTGGPINGNSGGNTGVGTISLANTAVANGLYGDAGNVATFVVDDQGRLTAASNVLIAISNTQVSGLGTMSTQDASNVNITGGTFTSSGNVTAAYFIGDGSQLSNINAANVTGAYANSNVANYLSSGSVVTDIITAANVFGTQIGNGVTYLYGDGSNITGISGNIIQNGTSNVSIPTANGSISLNVNGFPFPVLNVSYDNVSDLPLSTFYGDVTLIPNSPNAQGNLTATSIVAQYIGNSLSTISGIGTALTALDWNNISGANANVGSYLASGNITGNISTTGNVVAGYLYGDGSNITNLPSGNYSNANVANYLPTYSGVLAGSDVNVTGNANAVSVNLNGLSHTTAVGTLTTTTVPTTLFSYPVALFDALNFMVSASNGSSVYTTTIQGDSNLNWSVFGSTGVPLGTFDLVANVGNVDLTVTANDTTSTLWKVLVNVI